MTQQSSSPSKEDLITQGLIKEAYNKELSGAEIFVTVVNGVATLDGDVASDGIKRMAEEIARGVAGVTAIENKIESAGPGGPVGLIMNQDLNPVANSQPMSDASNTGDVSLHHPTTTDPSEVLPSTVDGPTGMDSGGGAVAFAPTEGVSPVMPVGGGRMSVMDAGAVDAMKVSGSALDDESVGQHFHEGMTVVDQDGLALGTVKTVRSTDFLLHRPLFSRDLYVPFFKCHLDGDQVRVDVRKAELGDQGWAYPS